MFFSMHRHTRHKIQKQDKLWKCPERVHLGMFHWQPISSSCALLFHTSRQMDRQTKANVTFQIMLKHAKNENYGAFLKFHFLLPKRIPRVSHREEFETPKIREIQVTRQTYIILRIIREAQAEKGFKYCHMFALHLWKQAGKTKNRRC